MMLDSIFPGGTFDAVNSCYVDPNDPVQMSTFEMAQFRTENFERKIMKNCYGKEKCSVEFTYPEFARLPASV